MESKFIKWRLYEEESRTSKTFENYHEVNECLMYIYELIADEDDFIEFYGVDIKESKSIVMTMRTLRRMCDLETSVGTDIANPSFAIMTYKHLHKYLSKIKEKQKDEQGGLIMHLEWKGIKDKRQ